MSKKFITEDEVNEKLGGGGLTFVALYQYNGKSNVKMLLSGTACLGTIARVEQGVYTVNHTLGTTKFIVFITGMYNADRTGNTNPLYGCVPEQTSSTFKLLTSDDDSKNDGYIKMAIFTYT